MEINLDQETLDRIKAEVIKKAVDSLVSRVVSEFNVKTIASEIRGAAISKLTSKYEKQCDTADIVTKAAANAERIVLDKISKVVANQICVSFK